MTPKPKPKLTLDSFVKKKDEKKHVIELEISEDEDVVMADPANCPSILELD